MDISQLLDFDLGLPTKMPRYLTGPAGLGKSSVVKMIAEKRGMKVVDIRLSELEPADLVGMPFVHHRTLQRRTLHLEHPALVSSELRYFLAHRSDLRVLLRRLHSFQLFP